jgi:hypothetical protein
MRIIGADERLNEPRGVKVLLIGPTGVGKTSQLHTLDPSRVLFLDGEAGDLSVQDVPVDTIRIDTTGRRRAISRSASAVPIRRLHRPAATPRRITRPSEARSKISTATT